MNSALVYKHPLRLSPVGGAAAEPGLDIPSRAQYAMLIFEPCREGWACIACAETYGAGVKPLLKFEDLERHIEAHQMGLDYAMVLKRKGVLK